MLATRRPIKHRTRLRRGVRSWVESYQHHGVTKLADEDCIPGDGAANVQLVGAIFLLALGYLRRRESIVDVGLEGLFNFLG